jgi:hypothetical protein
LQKNRKGPKAIDILILVRADELNVELLRDALEHIISPDTTRFILVGQVAGELCQDPDPTRPIAMRDDGLFGAFLIASGVQ